MDKPMATKAQVLRSKVETDTAIVKTEVGDTLTSHPMVREFKIPLLLQNERPLSLLC